jgi:hypothetical protein
MWRIVLEALEPVNGAGTPRINSQRFGRREERERAERATPRLQSKRSSALEKVEGEGETSGSSLSLFQVD